MCGFTFLMPYNELKIEGARKQRLSVIVGMCSNIAESGKAFSPSE